MSSTRELATIGVYGFDAASFLETLAAADVRAVFDVRQRRGVRGPEYAWANSVRLQHALADAGIEYQHHLELAPTTELRHKQYEADNRAGVGKRSRQALDPAYRNGYVREILDHVDLGEVIEAMPPSGTTALLCVERDAAACHRSIVADRLAEQHGLPIKHLLPPREANRRSTSTR